jgi:exopolyphosphatase/guanosine-5'-triphosphate,3'-diphosphate pyrophosphatase
MERKYKAWLNAHEEYNGYIEYARHLGCSNEHDGHSLQVARLALQLFDELKPLHGLDERARLFLHLAALLHDIGYQEGHKGHHKSSLRIIRQTPDLPFTEPERLVIGSIARYHRKALPSLNHSHFKMLKPAERDLAARAGALLRIADALDFSHTEAVRKVTCEIDKRMVILNCVLNHADVSIGPRLDKKKDLFVSLFDCEIQAEPILQG